MSTYALAVPSTLLFALGSASSGLAQSYALVNCGADGAQDLQGGYSGCLSEDGSRSLFISDNPALVPGDTNLLPDIYLRDRNSATTQRVNVSTTGVEADWITYGVAAYSRDVRFVVFDTRASNFDPRDTNGLTDYYVRDVELGLTELVSVRADGTIPQVDHSGKAMISDDGRLVAFVTGDSQMVAGFDTYQQLICRDRETGTSEILSLTPQGVPGSCCAYVAWNLHAFSADNRFVLFTSGITNLVPGDTNGERDCFLRDRLLGVTERVSLAHDGAQANQDCDAHDISPDGRFIVFSSYSSNLVPLDPFPGTDVFVRDRLWSTTRIASIPWDGGTPDDHSPSGGISPDGRYVTFLTYATNMTPDYAGPHRVVRDQVAQTTVSLFPPYPSGVSAWTPDRNLLLVGTGSGSFVPNAYPQNASYVADMLGSSAFTGYCTSKQNSANCLPVISCSGLPSVTGYDDAFVTSWNQLANKPGVFFWGVSPASLPFGGGTLCVQPPVTRTPVQFSTTDAGFSPCTGTYAFHLTEAYLASKGLGAGATFYGQWWGRDPGFAPPDNVSLTNAMSITVQP